VKALMRILKKLRFLLSMSCLPGLIEGYASEDIYNADETGLFFKCLLDKAYELSNKKWPGGKKSKYRATVMVCCNMTGNDKVELAPRYWQKPKAEMF
jgi:hypothetical protein